MTAPSNKIFAVQVVTVLARHSIITRVIECGGEQEAWDAQIQMGEEVSTEVHPSQGLCGILYPINNDSHQLL